MSDNIGVAEIHEWAQELEEIRELIGEQFARTEPRNNAIGYIQGLLSDEERKNFVDVVGTGREGHSRWDATVIIDHGLGPGRGT